MLDFTLFLTGPPKIEPPIVLKTLMGVTLDGVFFAFRQGMFIGGFLFSLGVYLLFIVFLSIR